MPQAPYTLRSSLTRRDSALLRDIVALHARRALHVPQAPYTLRSSLTRRNSALLRDIVAFHARRAFHGAKAPLRLLVADGFHDLGLEFLAELGVVVEQGLRGIATLGELRTLIAEPRA